MARQKSIIKLQGTLQGINFYKREGEFLARENTGPDRERILKDPKFKRTRENMNEFGAAAFLGKELRSGWTALFKQMGDSRMSARLTGVMRKIINAGRGPRGQRSFDLMEQRRHLEGFELNRNQALASVFYPTYALPETDANRNIVTWELPAFSIEEGIQAPEGATHYKLILASKVFGDYEYEALSKEYQLVVPDATASMQKAETDLIALTTGTSEATTLQLEHGFGEGLPEGLGLVNAIGIVFYQVIGEDAYVLESDNAMQLVNVL